MEESEERVTLTRGQLQKIAEDCVRKGWDAAMASIRPNAEELLNEVHKAQKELEELGEHMNKAQDALKKSNFPWWY